MEFVKRYEKVHKLETITLCGGEVFALTYIPQLINLLTQKGIFIQVITNGTIDRLNEFTSPNLINLIVSLDGLPEYHDRNRGEGNFNKSLLFLQRAQSLGFHTDVFSILTRQNLDEIDAFEAYLAKQLDRMPVVTYHPRKPPQYLESHPISNIIGETEGFDFLSQAEMIEVMMNRNVFPPKDLGCYQIALVSDGSVYGCCEGTVPIGRIDDPIEDITSKLRLRIEEWSKTSSEATCLGCSQSDFMCGVKQYLQRIQEMNNAPPAITSI